MVRYYAPRNALAATLTHKQKNLNASRTATQTSVALVLAGGEGRRVEGADKGLLPLGGQPLVEHVINRLSPQVSHIIISSNRNVKTYQEYGYTVVSDVACPPPDSEKRGSKFEGPLAGIYSALKLIESEPDLYQQVTQLVCVPCDTPHLPSDLVTRLEHFKTPQTVACVAHDGERQQNLHCLISRNAWESLQTFYLNGGRAIKEWFKTVKTERVDFSDVASSFQNYNSLTSSARPSNKK